MARPRAQHFANSIYFREPGGNTVESDYYDPQAAAEGRTIARPLDGKVSKLEPMKNGSFLFADLDENWWEVAA